MSLYIIQVGPFFPENGVTGLPVTCHLEGAAQGTTSGSAGRNLCWRGVAGWEQLRVDRVAIDGMVRGGDPSAFHARHRPRKGVGW